MAKKALVVLHPGFEEVEAVTPIDLLTRAGLEVRQVALADTLLVKGKNGMTVQATHRWSDLETTAYDLIVVPGGPGINKIRNHPGLCEMLRNQHESDRWIGCICAAPLLLLDADLLADRRYTAHFNTAKELPSAAHEPVVRDGKLITSRGAGTATQFALALITHLIDETKAREVADAICWPFPL